MGKTKSIIEANVNNDKSHLNEHLANEQTFLAWIRTGIEVIVFGIVAIKFSLFASQVMGIILVGVGTLMTSLAYLRYRKTSNQLNQGEYQYSTGLLTITAITLFVIGAILMVCLIKVHVESQNNQKGQKENSIS
jgi:putative membrane protein